MSENEEVKNEKVETPETPVAEPVVETPEVEAPKGVELQGLYGFKMGMSSVYNEKGERIPVTVVQCEPWVITQIKTQEVDGYEALQVSYGAKKAKNCNLPEKGHFKKAGLTEGMKFSQEIRQSLPEGVKLGQEVSVNSVQEGEILKVSSLSKGRGFAGVVKRHGFAGGPASHGSHFGRRPGTIGMCTFPGRVMKGKKMPGQYGHKLKTIKGIEVLKVLPEKNAVLLKGSVPGSKNTLVKMMKG